MIWGSDIKLKIDPTRIGYCNNINCRFNDSNAKILVGNKIIGCGLKIIGINEDGSCRDFENKEKNSQPQTLSKDKILAIIEERIKVYQSRLDKKGNNHDLNAACDAEIKQEEAKNIYAQIDKMIF